MRQTVRLAGLLLWSLGAQSEHYTLPLFVTLTSTDGITGVVRILNGSDESGSVEIYAIDDAGARSGPATFTLNAAAAAEFNASDLVSGNSTRGLTGGVGSPTGNVRLEIDTDLQIVPAAYVRAADGTLSTIHDTVRASAASGGGYEYEVPIFNPSTEMTHVSSLRLINPGDAAASVTIEGRSDNDTAASGGTVQVTLAAGAAKTLTAQKLEAGDTSLTGRLGAGAGVGKWRLTVSSDQPIQVVNVVSSTTGYMNNLSTTAVAKLAPADHDAFNERFLDNGIEFQTDSGDFTLTLETGDTFTEMGEEDGVAVTYTGSYAYEAIAPDAGQLTVSYDDGDECGANQYFTSLTGGWFASLCTGTDNPDGNWVGGTWSIVDDGGGGEVDRFPTFRNGTAPGNQAYTVGTAIGTLTLPEASSGDGTLTYSLSPTVPGLSFNAATRQLTGTPTTTGTHSMTYTAADADGDTDTLGFTITVSAGTPVAGSLGVCQVGMMLRAGQSCTYPGTADAFSVNTRGRGSFLGRLAGIRIRITNSTINGRLYDFEALNQGAGVWRINRIAGSTEVPTGGGNGDGGDEPVSATVAIPDANLRAALEATLGKASDDPITVGDMETLTNLTAHEARISDLTGLETAANLTVLYLGRNNISDPSPLSGLANLERLDIQSNNASNLSFLSGLTNLSYLSLGFNGITDISSLSALTNLRELWLYGNRISDVSPLSDLTNLTTLIVWQNNIANISSLAGLVNVKWLELSNNPITDLSPLAGLPNVTSLGLFGIEINDLSTLASWLPSRTNLDRLNLGATGITDILLLSELTNLTYLHLGNNGISDLSPLSDLTKLKELWLFGNNIADVSSLTGLTSLTRLRLGTNDISDISPLEGLSRLSDLELEFNRVTDISALVGLTALTRLDLRGNPLGVSSINDQIPVLQSSGATVFFDSFRIGEYDIELVFSDRFAERQKNVLRYVARRWMAIIAEDLPDYEFAQGWSGTCGDQSYEIPAGERIDDLRIHIGTFEVGNAVGYGGPSVLREDTHLPVVGCMAFNLSSANLLITGLHEIGHVLGFGTVWSELALLQEPDGDTHFNGPMAIAAFDEAGGSAYDGTKVPVEKMAGAHWRASVFPDEIMRPGGGSALSAITVQSMADLGYGVDVTQADAYTLPSAATALAGATTMAAIAPLAGDDPLRERLEGAEPVVAHRFDLGDSSLARRLAPPLQAEPALSGDLYLVSESIQVVDQQGLTLQQRGGCCTTRSHPRPVPER